MAIYKEIKKYSVFHISRDRARRDDVRHTIVCYSDDRGDIIIGALYFYKDSMTLPTNKSRSLNFHSSQFDSIINTLRVETPVNYFFADENYCGIVTGKEPTGEEEGSGA